MGPLVLDQLTGQRFIVQILPNGGVTAGVLGTMPLDALSIAVCDELASALGDALQGDVLGGRCWGGDDDDARPPLRVVGGCAIKQGV